MVSSAFPAGSEVEVRSNEEGFKGAWFEATVVKSLPKYRRYTVAYSTLVSDEITSKPLEDTVYYCFVRPRPRPRSNAGARFELHQLVEAFHNDGWWKGVVSEVAEGSDGLYKVCFPSSREEFEFKGEELREQLEWVKGNWVAVQDQEVEEEDLTFVVGSRVEVSRDKENYGAAWFVGTVLKVMGKSYFLVEYKSLRVDNDGSNGVPLKEIVDLQYIRPSPPPASKFDGFFDILEEVEAFHKGGWVAGLISELHRDSKYIVKSKHHDEEIEVDRTTIRPRFDWTNEHWVHISREKSSKSPGSRGKKSYSCRRKSLVVIRSTFPISAASFRDNDGEAGGRSDAASLKAKSEGPKVEERVETSQPRKKMKRGNSLEEHLKLVDGMKLVGRRCKRSRSGKRSSLSIAVLSSRNNNVDVVDRFVDVNLKDKKVEESPSEERVKSSQPDKNAGKAKSLEHLQLADSTLIDCGSKTPRNVGKSSSDWPIAEDIPALVSEERHSKRPSRQKVGKKSLSLSTNELHHEQDISKVDGTESINSVEGSFSSSGDVSEHQLKTGNVGHSQVRDEPVNFLPVADCRNHKVGSALTGNAKRRRKKLVVRVTHRKRKTPNFVDVKQHAQEEVKKGKRGRPPKKKIMYMDGMESRQLEEMKEVPVGGEGRREFGEPSNGTPTVDGSHNIESVCLEKVMECNESMMTITTKGNTPYICLCNMQADIMENSPETPDIEHSTVVAKLFKYSTSQQSPILESFNCRTAETESEIQTQACPSEQDNIGDHDKLIDAVGSPSLIPTGLENVVDMERSAIDPTPDGLSLLKEYDACDQNEVTASGSKSEKAFVEIEDRAPIDHSPSGSSISREDYVLNHDEFTPGGSLSEKTVIEIEKSPSDLTPSGSSPFKEDIRDPDELTPNGLRAEKIIIEVEGRTKIDSMPGRSLLNEVALSLIKESAMWEIVESMEVFHTMPQQPHFRPLEQYEVEFREGMAIGLMVTFANLVDSIQKLQVTDSQGIFQEKLRALIPLELNGFSVNFLRSRLEKLQEIQSNASESEGKKLSLKEKIMEEEEEKDHLDALVAAHDKIIMELEENLYCYRERRKSVLLGRDKKDSEIVQLKINLQATEGAYFSAKEHFNAVLDAPWEM